MSRKTIEENRLVRPKRLSADDTIAVVATASPFEPETVYKGAAVLEEMGFEVRIPPEAFFKDTFLAGSDQQRAELLNRLFADGTVDAIICARGGYGSLRMLNRLDYRLIQRNPKPFIGFSDVTAVLATLYQRCGLITFHGPVLSTLANADRSTRQALSQAVSSAEGVVIEPAEAITVYPGRVTQPVLAGNLTTFCHLLGTPFVPDFSDHILLIEDSGEPVYRIDRMLTQMKLAGCFDAVAGIALGSFSDCGRYDAVVAAFEHAFQARPVPMLAGFEVGHGPGNPTVPVGLTATLDTGSRQLRYSTAATDD